MKKANRSPGDTLLSTTYIVSMFGMFFNDHYWKGVGPSWLTGKLSDVLILIVAPLMLQALIEFILQKKGYDWGPNRFILIGICIFFSFCMIAINLWHVPASLYCWILGSLQWPFLIFYSLFQDGTIPNLIPVQLYMDQSDCWTAPSSLIPIIIFWNRHKTHKG